jgi:hypothetical protein
MNLDNQPSDSLIDLAASKSNIFYFCCILIFEVYGLAIAIGGRWVETSFFFLVCLSQVSAGAFIWLEIRKYRETRLPELIAMGLAIGVSFAAFSQLIIRDLLGISLPISPYLPIIVSAILFSLKRNKRPRIQITNVSSMTLTWLLLPAPLAMAHYVPILLFSFVAPFACISFLYYKNLLRRNIDTSLGFESFAFFITVLCALCVITRICSAVMYDSLSAITSIDNDILFDYAHAKGFTLWGINENINVVGQSFSYYKFTYLWLGPLIISTPLSSPLLLTTLLPLLFYCFIGLGLWAVTKHLSQIDKVANFTLVIFFFAMTSPEPYVVQTRPLYLMANFSLICAFIVVSKAWEWQQSLFAVHALVAFILASIRLQFALIFIAGLIFSEIYSSIRNKEITKKSIVVLTSMFLGTLISISVFYSSTDSANFEIGRQSFLKLLGTTVDAVLLKSILPLILLIIVKSNLKRFENIIFIILASLLYHFLFPQNPTHRDDFWIILLFSAPFLATLILESLNGSGFRKTLPQYFIFLFLGILFRLNYDLYKWSDLSNQLEILKLLKYFSDQGSKFFISVVALVLVYFCSKSFRKTKNALFSAKVAFSLTCFLCGIGFATTLRSITTELRYSGRAFAPHEENSITQWFLDDNLKFALNEFSKLSDSNDIFATNVHPYDENMGNYGSTLVLTSLTGRRSLVEAPGYEQGTREITLAKLAPRIEASLGFPVTPGLESAKYLNDFGVRWLIIDLARTPSRSWEPWATTRFINSRIAILELNPKASD